MIEKVNPKHSDKLADRIAGAIVDLAYTKEENPKVAVEVLIGHGNCYIIAESSVEFEFDEIRAIVARIAGSGMLVTFNQVQQDIHLANNQAKEIRCGDNGIFKGVPLTEEEKELSKIARDIYNKYPSDGKYILDGKKLIICQSNAIGNKLAEYYDNEGYFTTVNPLGDWTGGTDIDSGSVNRKIGSDMAQSVTGGGLCLSGDSEYLSDDYKWHKISEYSGGSVAEWVNGKLNFVQPLKYVHNKEDDLIYIHNNSKLSMCLTPYHEMLIKTSKGNLIKKQAKEIAEKLFNEIGNSGSIIHNFTYNKPSCAVSAYSDENDYRLQVAFCADGTVLHNQQKWNGRIRVKKQSKKERLRELLNGKNYLETQDGDYSIFWYKFTKKDKSLYNCFKDEDWGILKDEIFYWDGDNNRKLFRTTIKSDADFMQLVLQSFGDTVGIQTAKTTGNKSILYTVHIYKSNQTHLRKSKGNPINVEYITQKQDSYCFEVPSHNLVVRHRDKIFVTGNCGKDLSKADVSVNIYTFLKAQELGCIVTACCAIGDKEVTFNVASNNEDVPNKETFKVPYSDIVEIARNYIKEIGGFEKFAEWGLF